MFVQQRLLGVFDTVTTVVIYVLGAVLALGLFVLNMAIYVIMLAIGIWAALCCSNGCTSFIDYSTRINAWSTSAPSSRAAAGTTA